MQFIPAHWLELAAWNRGPHGLTVYAREIRPPARHGPLNRRLLFSLSLNWKSVNFQYLSEFAPPHNNLGIVCTVSRRLKTQLDNAPPAKHTWIGGNAPCETP